LFLKKKNPKKMEFPRPGISLDLKSYGDWVFSLRGDTFAHFESLECAPPVAQLGIVTWSGT
jgi:hypothetical protein